MEDQSKFSELLSLQKSLVEETKTIGKYIAHIDEMVMFKELTLLSRKQLDVSKQSKELQEKNNKTSEKLLEKDGALDKEIKAREEFALQLAMSSKSFKGLFGKDFLGPIRSAFTGLKDTFSSKENFKIAALEKLNFGGIFNKAIEKQKYIRQEKALGSTDSISNLSERFIQRNKVINQIKDNEAEIAKEAEYQGTTPDKLAPITDRAKELLEKRERLTGNFSSLSSSAKREQLTGNFSSSNRNAVLEERKYKEEQKEQKTQTKLLGKIEKDIPDKQANIVGKGTMSSLGGTDGGGKGLKAGGLGKGLLGITGAMAAIGAGIAAFFIALSAADMIIGKLGDGSSLKKLLVNIGEGLEAFSGQGLLALGALLGAGALFGAVGGVKVAGKAAVGIGAIGLGLGLFFAGLAVGDGLASLMGADGDKIKNMMVNLAEGLGAFDANSLMAFGGLLGAGALFGAVSTKVAGKAAVGMGAVGLGLGLFFTGLAAGDGLTAMMGADGGAIKTMMINLAEGLGAFSGPSLVAFGSLLAAGALFGAVGGAKAALGAGLGMGAVGLGLGLFFAGLGAGEKVMKWIGADGSGVKEMMINLAEGLGAFGKLDGDNLLKAGEGAVALAAGLAGLAGAKIGDLVSDFFGWVGSFFKKEGPIEGIQKFVVLAKDADKFKLIGEGLKALGEGLWAFAKGAKELQKLGDIDFGALDKITPEQAEKLMKFSSKGDGGAGKSIDISGYTMYDEFGSPINKNVSGSQLNQQTLTTLSTENEMAKSMPVMPPAVNVVDGSNTINNVSNNKAVIGRMGTRNMDSTVRNYSNSSLQFVSP